MRSAPSTSPAPPSATSRRSERALRVLLVACDPLPMPSLMAKPPPSRVGPPPRLTSVPLYRGGERGGLRRAFPPERQRRRTDRLARFGTAGRPPARCFPPILTAACQPDAADIGPAGGRQ